MIEPEDNDPLEIIGFLVVWVLVVYFLIVEVV